MTGRTWVEVVLLGEMVREGLSEEVILNGELNEEREAAILRQRDSLQNRVNHKVKGHQELSSHVQGTFHASVSWIQSVRGRVVQNKIRKGEKQQAYMIIGFIRHQYEVEVSPHPYCKEVTLADFSCGWIGLRQEKEQGDQRKFTADVQIKTYDSYYGGGNDNGNSES